MDSQAKGLLGRLHYFASDECTMQAPWPCPMALRVMKDFKLPTRPTFMAMTMEPV